MVVFFRGLAFFALLRLVHTCSQVPAPPEPEPITVTRLPLPPVAPSSDPGACSRDINPHGTGCIAKTSGLQSGNFLPDDKHLTAIANFTGAPAAPDPASIYDGLQLMILKVDGSRFPNGDSWKCITCGVTEENSRGRTASLDYPQSFRDGKSILAGANIIECDSELADESCTPAKTRIMPLRWNTTPDGSGSGGEIRELRLHPDNVHIGFNSFDTGNSGGAVFGQLSFVGRLERNRNPVVGQPLVSRFDITNVTILFDQDRVASPTVDPNDASKLIFRQVDPPVVGELRGFGGTGREVTYIGPPVESSNIDVFAADLSTGVVRRLTAHPEYVDPVDVSPDDKWHVVLDTRGTNRQMFISGLRGIPPLTDLVSTAAVSSTRNNGQRRFFLPWMIDQYGDRGDYFGQQVNAEGSGVPGSGDINDPEWNGRADPKWSWDGTRIAYTQAQTVAPACGGENPLPCYPSTEPGGRTERIMIAHLTSREGLPLPPPEVDPIPDSIPWGTPYHAGDALPYHETPPAGNYTLDGKYSGWARVNLVNDEATGVLGTVSVTYYNLSDDGENVLSGRESVTRFLDASAPALQHLLWHSNLTVTGPNNGTKVTSPGGFRLQIDVLTNIFQSDGTMTTTVDGVEYLQPADGT